MNNPIETLLESDHESLGRLLSELDLSLASMDIPRSFELLDLFWVRLAVHIRAENLHLFPALANASPSLVAGDNKLPKADDVRVLIEHLRSDHEFFMKELADMIRVMRELSANPQTPDVDLGDLHKRLEVITSRLELHNELEETQAYKWPGLLFEDQMVDSLGQRMQQELENLPQRVTKSKFDVHL